MNAWRRLDLVKIKRTSVFRKLSMAVWQSPNDPTVYSLLEIDLKKTLELLPEYEKKYGVNITPTHLVAKACAHAISCHPQINSIVRFGRLYQRPTIDLFFQVHQEETHELTGVTIRNIDQLSLVDLTKALKQKSQRVRNHQDKHINASYGLFKIIPWRLLGPILNFFTFLHMDLNLNLSFLGFAREPFGSMMITSVGKWDIDLAFAPIVPFSRVPALMTVGRVKDKPWVDHGELVIRPILPIGFTFDHRVIDGGHGAQLSSKFRECFQFPEKFFFND